jgi:D-lactate dehydrogenase (cytochrome)
MTARAAAPDRSPPPSSFLDAIAARFGEDAFLSENRRRPYGQSEAHFADALPDAVVVARSTGDVIDCVSLCAEHSVPLTAFGAGTSIEGNALPIHGGVTIDLSGMDRIVEVNVDDCDCTVEAGVRRAELNAHLRDTGLFFPIDPGANATIGGMASTRASGTNAVRYGTRSGRPTSGSRAGRASPARASARNAGRIV